MDFNNREIATLVWMAVLVAVSFILPSVRGAAVGVLRAFFQRKLLTVFGVAGAYIAASVLLLHRLGIWEVANLKTTIWWALTTAFVSMFDITRIDEDKTYFRKSVRDTLSASTIVVFIAEFYALSLWVELLLIPVAAFLAGMKATADLKPEQAAAGRCVGTLLALIGLSYFGYSAYQTVTHLREFATLDTLGEFGIPILLSLMFLPCLYVMSVLTVYENVFVALWSGIDDPKLRRYAKRNAILRFRLNLELLKRWRRQVMIDGPGDRESIRRSFAEVKAARQREKNPPPVQPGKGWSPYQAKEFLKSEGFETNDYHRSFETWYASMTPIEIGEDLWPDNLAYYIEGDEEAAKQLRLQLNVNSPEGQKQAEQRFYDLARSLITVAIDDDASAAVSPLIEAHDTLDEVVSGRRVRLVRDEFTGIKGGYSRKLIIDHDADSTWTPY